ncbi:MAG: hypothetical protein BWX54_01565 [Verrucomicrobia bacterium ADurb.Bin018]|nr:MAG: hypothetical protein BWX54_01565 [Verrucomicrobia bacterium ADurb.Bin018]
MASGAQRRAQRGHIQLGIVREHRDIAGLIHACRSQARFRPLVHDFFRGWEELCPREVTPRVHHGHAEATARGHGAQLHRNGRSPDNQQQRFWRDGLGEPRRSLQREFSVGAAAEQVSQYRLHRRHGRRVAGMEQNLWRIGNQRRQQQSAGRCRQRHHAAPGGGIRMVLAQPDFDFAATGQPHLQRGLECCAIGHDLLGRLAAQQAQEVFAQIAFHAAHRNRARQLAALVHHQPRAGLPRRRMLRANQNGLGAGEPRGRPRLQGRNDLFHGREDTLTPRRHKAETFRARRPPRGRRFPTLRARGVGLQSSP